VKPARIEVASLADAEAILALIKRAFAPVGVKYGDATLPPLVETIEEFRARFASDVVLKALVDDRIVGAVIGTADGATCRVGRLVVEPEFQGQGIGRGLATEIERHFPDSARFELFTGDRSAETLGLYASLGYRETGRERVDRGPVLVFLEKRRS